ncbi:MAG: hypothetical protein AAF390_16780 [Pseudomonadota bacterium]
MAAFFASLGWVGWALLGLFVFAVVTAPRALREYWRARERSRTFYRDLSRGRGRRD